MQAFQPKCVGAFFFCVARISLVFAGEGFFPRVGQDIIQNGKIVSDGGERSTAEGLGLAGAP